MTNKNFTTGYQSFIVNHASGDANEAANGDMFVDRDYVTLGYESGTPVGAQKAFFRFELSPEQAAEISGKEILPESYITFPIISGYDVPFSGKMYCEVAASSDIMDATNSAISARNKTAEYFELGSEQFSGPVHAAYNDNLISYWDFDSPLGYQSAEGGNYTSGVYPDRMGRNNFHHNGPQIQQFGWSTIGGGASTSVSSQRYLDTVSEGFNGEPPPSSSFSVEFWLEGPTLDDGDHALLVQANKTDSEFSFNISRTGVSQWVDAGLVHYDGGNFTAATNHMAFTYNGETSEQAVFQNGVFKSGATGGINIGSTFFLEVGSVSSNSFVIDELAFYNVALTSGEIAARYNNGLGNRYPGTIQPFMDSNYDTRIGYAPHKPIQELIDSGEDLRTISFVYENTFGSGHRTVSTFEEGNAPELHLFYADSGTDVVESTLNSGMILHWDADSYADRINKVCMGHGVTDTYGIYGSGYNHNGYYNIPMRADNYNERRETLNASSVLHFNDTFSFGFWATPEHHNRSNCLSISALVSGDEVHSYAKTNIRDRLKAFEFSLSSRIDRSVDMGFFVFPDNQSHSSINPYANHLKSSGGVERDRWSYYYAEYTHAGVGVGLGVNGDPLHSGNPGTIITNSGGLVIDAQGWKIDELSFWNRTLSLEERTDLYNHRYPWSYDKPPANTQTMWPYEDVAGGFYSGVASRCSLFALDFENLDYRTDSFLQYWNFDGRFEGTWGFPYFSGDLSAMEPGKSGHFSSLINDWYAGLEQSGYGVTAMRETNDSYQTFKTGPIQIKPSSITFNCWMKAQDDFSTYWPPLVIPQIREVTLYDNSTPRKTIGNYLSSIMATKEIAHSSVELTLQNEEGYDYTNTELEFRTKSGYSVEFGGITYVSFLDIHAVNLEVSGDVSIAQTGLSLYVDGIGQSNSGVDLYTMSTGSENSGIDLYTYGHEIKTRSIPMYMDGNLATNSGIDLFLAPHDSLTFNKSLFIHGFTTDNSGMELYTHGALLDNSGIDLYTYGVANDNSGVDMYTVSFEAINSGMDLYMSGIGRPTSGIDLTIWGKDTMNSGVDLVTWGHLATNSGMDLWTQGVQLDNGAIPFFAEATVSYGSGSFPLYINSTTNTSVYKARPMYLEVNSQETDTGTIPFFLNSVSTADDTGYMPFFLESKADSITRGTDMYLQNAFESGYKSQFLYVKGLGTLDGGAVDNGSMPLFIERIEGVENGMSMYLGVNSGDEQGVNMYTFGGTWSSSGVDLVIPSTIDTKNSGLNIFIGGF
jgi:hypothetical protein